NIFPGITSIWQVYLERHLYCVDTANVCSDIIVREIIYYQTQDTSLLIPKAVFGRKVKELAGNILGSGSDLRFSEIALDLFQLATEKFVIKELTSSAYAMLHANAVTLKQADMEMVQTLRFSKDGFRIHR